MDKPTMFAPIFPMADTTVLVYSLCSKIER